MLCQPYPSSCPLQLEVVEHESPCAPKPIEATNGCEERCLEGFIVGIIPQGGKQIFPAGDSEGVVHEKGGEEEVLDGEGGRPTDSCCTDEEVDDDSHEEEEASGRSLVEVDLFLQVRWSRCPSWQNDHQL